MREKVVAHLRDGEIVKGYSRDFSDSIGSFHILNNTEPVATSRKVAVDDLKALFFVRTWGRSPGLVLRNYRFGVGGMRGEPGRRAMVKFQDGEKVWGYVMPHRSSREGFYLIPADPEDNNLKIYVVRSSLDEIYYLETAALKAGGHGPTAG